jgi:hypothetical protein
LFSRGEPTPIGLGCFAAMKRQSSNRLHYSTGLA